MNPTNGTKANEKIQPIVDTGARFCITIQTESTAM